MSIYATQHLYDAAVHALAAHPRARRRADQRRAFVTVSVPGAPTKAVVLRKTAGAAWDLEAIYTADHETPGATGVVVQGVW